MLLTITTSIIFAELKEIALKNLSLEVERLWNTWEIRGMILLSLSLQIVLVGLGEQRGRQRYTGLAKPWTSLLMWSTYLSADWLATVSLSTLLRSEKERYTAPVAFWTPFLLLHLGGPDSITAYALEDNELWLRHLISVCYQVGVASYVCWKFKENNGGFTFLAIPIFVAGIIKNGERLWSLRNASREKLKQSVLSSYYQKNIITLSRETTMAQIKTRTENLSFEEEAMYLHEAFRFHTQFMRIILDIEIAIPEQLYHLHTIDIENTTAVRAFKFVADELEFWYDKLHTKRPLLNSRLGAILRFVSFLSCTATLLAFSLITGLGKEKRSKVDIGISCLLLFGAFSLEIFSITSHTLSHWGMLLITKHKKQLPSFVNQAAKSWLVSRYRKEKLESILLPSFNMINSCLKPKLDVVQKILNLDMALLRGNYHTTLEDVNNLDLKEMIYSHLVKKQKQYKESNFDYQFLTKLLDNMGDGVLRENGVDQLLGWSISKSEDRFPSDVLLLWHIATHCCYTNDIDKYGIEILSCHHQISMLLSEYLMYILIMRPSMLPKTRGLFMWSEPQVRVTIAEIRRYHWDNNGEENAGENPLPAMSRGFSLANDLHSLVTNERWGYEDKWKLICEVWIEILIHVAAHCTGEEHVRQLYRGGELLTHVYLLMVHMSLSPIVRIIRFPEEVEQQLSILWS